VHVVSKLIFGADIRMQMVCAPDVMWLPSGWSFPEAQSGSARSSRQRDQAWIRLIATMNLCRYRP
jgi:hypothetical protein